MDLNYKHFRVKQYLKEGKALRTATVVNQPSDDVGVMARRPLYRQLHHKCPSRSSRNLSQDPAAHTPWCTLASRDTKVGWCPQLGLTDHLIGQSGQSARCNSNHHGTGDA